MSQSNAPQANANAFLAQAPISKLLLRFSVPCVLSLLVSALYNIVDQIFIGQGVGYLGNAATTVVYPFTVIALAVALLVGDGCAAVANNMIVLYGPASEYGADIPLSAIGIVMKVFAIVIAFAVGIAVGGQPIVGYNYGAGRYDRVLETLKGILLANVVVGLIAAALFELCPMAIISLFGNESGLYNQYAVLCFRVYLAGILLCCIQKASSIFLQSMGKPLQSTLLSLARDVIFFVPGLVLLAPRYGVVGMLWAAPIADVLAILATAILIRREVRAIQALRQA